MPENLLPPPANIDSLKRISGTKHIPLFKYALPAVMYVAVCAWMLSDESKMPPPTTRHSPSRESSWASYWP